MDEQYIVSIFESTFRIAFIRQNEMEIDYFAIFCIVDLLLSNWIDF